ncbi:MAG: Gfo/Idh/MocA family oxidoreductase [Alphaproteobacteria bacterium]|nr:Gfo/Idh/MocA family oxidoreductase [Alphaproteobacteria bacterium]
MGCGMWGRNIARNLAGLGALAGVGDLDQSAAQAFADEFSAPVMGVDDAIANPDIDGLAIVTSAPSHAMLAVAALNAGKAVYIEKPLALTVDDAEKIAAAASANARPVMVGHLIRHHAAFQRLLKEVQSGAIGKLRHIRASRIAPGRIRNTESVLFDLCPHDLALIAALTGQEEPAKVQCHGFSHVTTGVHDSVTAQLNFPSGITASVQANWLNPVKIHNLTVIGDNGAFVFDDTRDWAEKLTRFAFAVTTDGDAITLDRDDGTAIAVDPAEPLKDEMRNFIAATRGQAAPLTDITEALYVQRIMARMEADLN